MFETKKYFEGLLIDQGKFEMCQHELDKALSEIANIRGSAGLYEIRIRWYSEDDRNKIAKLNDDAQR
jgi:hypothetical protein